MIINRGALLKIMLKRMPAIHYFDMMYYINCVIELLIKRILEDRLTMVDGFGVLYRAKQQPRRVFNVVTRECHVVVSNLVSFRPHKAFLRVIDENGIDFIKAMVKKKSAEEISARKRKKRLI